MKRDISNINKQVILVVDKDRKRRIEKGYYGGDIDQSKIAVVSSVDNIIVDEKPDTSDLGKCTYIRSDFDPGMYYRIDNYQYKCAEKRQSALINILKRLQISDYYVVSRFRFKAKAEIGNKTNMKIEGGVKSSFYGAGLNGNYNPDQQGAVSANVGCHKDIVDEWHYRQKCEEPTDSEWQEAKKIAIASGLYNNDVIKALVDAREPNKGSILKSTHKEVRLGTNISLDINIFKFITRLLCFNYKLLEANGSGSNTKTFNFHAEANGEYVTDIIYNFDPKETERFKELVESYKTK